MTNVLKVLYIIGFLMETFLVLHESHNNQQIIMAFFMGNVFTLLFISEIYSDRILKVISKIKKMGHDTR